MRRIVSFGPAMVVLLVAAVVLIAGPQAMQAVQSAKVAAAVQIAQARLDKGNPLEALDAAVREISNATLPGVAHIEILSEPEFIPQIHGNDSETAPAMPRNHPLLPSTGSGWVYDNLGHIITNAHVIRDAKQVRVELYDGRVFDAEVLGFDRPTDIAVIRIDPGPSQLFPLRRGGTEPVYVGDHVFAFGSPFGFKFSMTQGIVSGLGRSEAASFVGMLGGYTNFIQTDAAMNPGNSGGPIVNSRGRVIGMSTAIANNRTESDGIPLQGQNAGLGFAIPVETIESVVDQMVASGVVLRGYLGITLDINRELDPAIATKAGYSGRGVVVAGDKDPEPDVPSGKAGLKRGDIIVEIDGKPTGSRDVLRSIVSIKKPGDRITIKFWRDGKLIETSTKLGAAYVVGTRMRPVPGSDEMSLEQIKEWITKTDGK